MPRLLFSHAFVLTLTACSVYDESLLNGPSIPTDTGLGGAGSSAEAASGGGGSSGTVGAGSGGVAGAAGSMATGGSNDGAPATNDGAAAVDASASRGDSGVQDALPDAIRPNDASSEISAADARADVGADVRDAAGDAQGADVDAVACVGSALSLNGSTYALVNRPVQDDFTLEAWIKTTSSLSGNFTYEGRGLLYADVVGGHNDFGSSILNSRLSFSVGNPPNADIMLTSTSNVATGQWVHVAMTRKRNTGALQILVNGAVEDSNNLTQQNSSLSDAASLTIGAESGHTLFFVGLLDEVRIWNVVRTPAQITASMHQRLTGNETGLVGYWRFDDVGGTTALDSSPTGAGARFTGSPAWVAPDALCAP